jgi:ankyrin repeat protein
MNGYYDIVKLLIENKSEVNAKQNDGWNSLILAAIRGHSNVVELLINNNANVNYKGKDGVNALMWGIIDGIYYLCNSIYFIYIFKNSFELGTQGCSGYFNC